MAQTTFSIRMDSSLKKEFDKLCEEFGMSMSTAINVFARAVVRERRIPFDVMSASAPAYAAERRAIYNANPVASHMLKTMQQLSADAEKAGAADMSLDEINSEISAARRRK
ncbi:MAG: type II toxin-antitoxin system RelB/DinJ family antitoxin [Fibrobacter sp.]|jgi:addiction module RelB/DinJ family antitoxin|nr:type II toxin-antitoxin system RelB/DinJ family antitoxin [Fibrobacter sp.]